jgi:hypothetical protein
MRFILSALCIVSVYSNFFAQFNPGAKQISIANSDVALSNDVFSLFNNPAGLSQMNWRELGVYYSPSPFGFTELANGFFSYHEPTDLGSFAIGGMTYGFELYRENKITLGYSFNFNNNFFSGAAVNYHMVFIKNYGSTAAFYFDIGGLIYLSDSFRWGFFVHNINHASFGKEDDQIPLVMNTGFSYDIVSQLSFNFSLEKDIRYNASLQAGINYDIIENISLRSGFSNNPSSYSGGLGINYSFFSIDYALINHPDLGLTHQAGIIICFTEEGTRSSRIKEYLGKKE